MGDITHPPALRYGEAQPAATKNAANVAPSESANRNHLLAAMRVGSVRLQLAKLELDSIGCALKGGLITTDEAFDWLSDAGALSLIDTVLGGDDTSEESVQ